MSRWDVVEHTGMWIGQIGMPPTDVRTVRTAQGHHTSATYVPPRFVAIMPSSFPWELAVDALLDFMDRLRTSRVPVGIDNPKALMDLCVSAARRQR